MEFISGLLPRQRRRVTQDMDKMEFEKADPCSTGEGSLEDSQHPLLKFTSYFGWLIGILPVWPGSIAKFQVTQKNFLLYYVISAILLLFLSSIKWLTISQISRSPYNSTSDKLTSMLAEFASGMSDMGIRSGFLLRAAEIVLLYKGIQDYIREFGGFRPTYAHRLVKNLTILVLHWVYLTWVIGFVLRKLRVARRTEESWRNVTFVFFPEPKEDIHIVEISDVLCHVSAVLSSYFLLFLVVSVSYVLIELLTEFKAKLKEDLVSAQMRSAPSNLESLEGFTTRRRLSLVDFQLYVGGDSSNKEKCMDKASSDCGFLSGFESSSKLNVSHKQFSSLMSLFRRFNYALGFSLVASVAADLMMIISVIFSVISKVLDSNSNNEDAYYTSIMSGSGAFTELFIAISEAEYEARLGIIAFVGSYLCYQITTAKTELEELYHGSENKSPQALSVTLPGNIYRRFMEWRWSLDGLDIFTINLRLLTTVIGTVTTYVIILLQVRMSEKSLNL